MLEDTGDATHAAFLAEPSVVYQAAFFNGEFFGYADFVERADDGWRVCDAKLARSAKPQALLQLGAYADQIAQLGLPLSRTASLLLGSGERADFAVTDLLPVFRERRDRLRAVLAAHQSDDAPVTWADDRYLVCGRCAECGHAAALHHDVIKVAGLRMEQRTRLMASGIATMADLGNATNRPSGMAASTFAKLRDQAALQWQQMSAGEGAPVEYVLTASAPDTLCLLPAPSAGDLFFDFEGDPLYDEGDPTRPGLEYLWGALDTAGMYLPLWAHSAAEEKAAFIQFMDDVAIRRAAHPDMHIYHYAPYETTALKRLAMRCQVREKELDDLLRSEVFVDLYATVRGSVMVSAPSYSIKKLEPLYMGDDLRTEDGVQGGDASILAYHEFRDIRLLDPATAQTKLDALADYNWYDCRSTLKLRDWLLERAVEAGVGDQIVPRIKIVEGEESSDDDPVFLALMARSGPAQRPMRTGEEQARAMLATAIDYYRREGKQYWWSHYERLGHPVNDWPDARDIFVAEAAEIVTDWTHPGGKARNLRRVVRLTGSWTAGSKPGNGMQVIYSRPFPAGVNGPDGAPNGAGGSDALDVTDTESGIVLLTESRKASDIFSDLPVALTPASPPGAKPIEEAIKKVAAGAASAGDLPGHAAADLLARRAPRLRDGGALPVTGDARADVVAALLAMDNSYVAIQGPPGTGKTWTGSRVVKDLVQKHGWRIGVVGQSHAVVENMLAGIVEAGLDEALVAKRGFESTSPKGTDIKNEASYLDEHVDTGCVVGGTAWAFANDKRIPRGSLDLLVVDEAGQFSLAPTIGASVAAARLLLLGDPQQLPQVSQGTHAEPVDESALGWVMDGHETIPLELGYFLGASYRMHPALCAKVSDLSYDGRLHSADAAGLRQLDGIAPGLHVVEVDHTGNRTESPEEAAAVVEQVRAHLGRTWTDPAAVEGPRTLGEQDVLVVAPYNAQVAMIRRALDEDGLSKVRVGTVDKFQGQEAPIAIVSMTASSHGDVPRGMGFLLSRNRINVAVSRAQWRAVLIRSGALTSYMPSSAAGVLELGGFIGLCDTTDTGRAVGQPGAAPFLSTPTPTVGA